MNDLAKYKTSIPYIRWFYPNDTKDLEGIVRGRGFLPELLIALALFFIF